MLYTSIMITSTFLEKPHTAPSKMPMVMLMSAQVRAREMEILEPTHTASKVGSPEAPAPRIQWMLLPNLAMAAVGVKCLAVASVRLAKRSYSMSMGYTKAKRIITAKSPRTIRLIFFLKNTRNTDCQ